MKALLVILWVLLAGVAEAATTCTLQKYCSGTASDGTWLQVNLPAGTAYVTIECSGACYVDGPLGGYTDGAARSSGGRATAAGEVVAIPIWLTSATTPIYVAGSGASRTVTIYPAGPEGR